MLSKISVENLHRVWASGHGGGEAEFKLLSTNRTENGHRGSNMCSTKCWSKWEWVSENIKYLCDICGMSCHSAYQNIYDSNGMIFVDIICHGKIGLFQSLKIDENYW